MTHSAHPMRLLLLITDLETGGAPHVVRDLSVRLRDDLGIDVEVACLSGAGPVADQIRAAGVPVHALGARGAWDVRLFPRLYKLIKRGRFDVVFSHLVHANAAAWLATRGLPGVRLVQAVHTAQLYPRWHWWVQGLVGMQADRVVAVSQSVADSLADRSLLPIDRIDVIYNGVPPVTINRQRAVRDGRFQVGFVGRFDPIKRVPELVRAVAQLDDCFHLELFGEGGDRARIEQAIRASGIAHRVTLHGFVPVADALGQVDALVLCSAAEGLGLVVAEAMSAGVPVVVANVPGIRDAVSAERDALVVDEPLVPGLATALKRLAEDDALRARLSAEGRLTYKKRFTWEAALPAYRRLLLPGASEQA